MALTEYKRLDPATPSPLSVDTPGDKRSGPVEDRFKRILERRRNESEEESMDETLVKPVRTWKWGIRLNQDHQGRSSPLKSC